MQRPCPSSPALSVSARVGAPLSVPVVAHGSEPDVACRLRPLAGRQAGLRIGCAFARLTARLSAPASAVLLVFGLTGCGPAPDEPLRRWQVDTADLARGRTLMAHYQCGSCHAVPGVPGGAERAPELARFGRRSYIAGQLPNTPETLQRWLLDPPGMLPGTTMPRLGLSERDARDIAGYLMSLQ